MCPALKSALLFQGSAGQQVNEPCVGGINLAGAGAFTLLVRIVFVSRDTLFFKISLAKLFVRVAAVVF